MPSNGTSGYVFFAVRSSFILQLNQARIAIFYQVPEFGCEAHAQDIRQIVLDLILPRFFFGLFGRGQHICLVSLQNVISRY
jgi:hypothetical protein